jgi:cysteine synthase A
MQQILSVLPAEWRGTTFNNSKLLGREGFATKLEDLISRKFETGEQITGEDLGGIGNAEDYLRVATNISTALEVILAREKGLSVSNVFSFASETLPIFAVGVVSKRLPVKLYLGKASSPFTPKQLDLLRLLGIDLAVYPSYRIKPSSSSEVVLALDSAAIDCAKVDAVVAPNILYILNPEKIVPSEILVVRKRMSTPVTTPVAEGWLQLLAGMRVTANMAGPLGRPTQNFYDHLQHLSGTPADSKSKPVVATAGLSALSSLWVSLIARGGVDVVMCSTAYGGTVQMTALFDEAEAKFRKHDFHVQGEFTSVTSSIQVVLNKLVADKDNALPLTVIFIEVPTNPDMKVPDIQVLANMAKDYQKASGKEVMLLLDTTFAPGSSLMGKVRRFADDACVMCFISLSKSVSRGLTTAGALVANHTPMAKDILKGADETCKMLDTEAKPDQLKHLVENHSRVVERCRQAYEAAATVGDKLQQTVREVTGSDMSLGFVAPEDAAAGFTTSSFSFNLPAIPNMAAEVNEGLAQRYVDSLCEHPQFKPCVSFGQDNGLVYCTVPATSTQGAVKAEHKAKQAVGGVQLVRLSFPPTCDIEAVGTIMAQSVRTIYEQ